MKTNFPTKPDIELEIEKIFIEHTSVRLEGHKDLTCFTQRGMSEIRTALQTLIATKVNEARINELENIFEYGYPASANTGVATRLCEAPNNTIQDRISELTKKGKDRE